MREKVLNKVLFFCEQVAQDENNLDFSELPD